LDSCLGKHFFNRWLWIRLLMLHSFGDVLDLFIAVQIMNKCKKVSCGLGSAQNMMYLMIALDFIIGLIPFLGDFLDGMIKANTFNVRQLEKRLDEVYKQGEKTPIVWGKSDRARPPPPASVWEDFDDDAPLNSRGRQHDVEMGH